MKRFLLILLSLCLLCSSVAVAEKPDEEALIEEYTEILAESDRTFTVPVGVGIFYSVILRKDGIGIVFTPVKSKSAAMSLETIAFLTDLREVDVGLENGQHITFPAVVQIQSYDVGTFITLNVSESAASSIAKVVASDSPVVTYTFIQNDNKQYDVSPEELNKSIGDVFGGVVDFSNQAASAVAAFWENLSQNIGIFAEDSYAAVEKALVQAGDYLSGTWTMVEQSLSEFSATAGEAITSALDTAGEAVNEALDTAGDLLEDAGTAISDFWGSLWGK